MIGIVTAFFDIGRGSWTPDKGLPHYLHRTTDTYMERFGHLAKLDNPMVVYTSENFKDRILKLRNGKPTEVVVVDLQKKYSKELSAIAGVQQNPEYLKLINPSQVRNPEYWSPEYVLINYLKTTFAQHTIENKLLDTKLISWMDFGYCRDDSTFSNSKHWNYDFDESKIHFFIAKDYDGIGIVDVIANNIVYIMGSCFIASQNKWPLLKNLMEFNLNRLLENNLIDDDQTLLLMSYLTSPDDFKLHKVQNNDNLSIVKDYNDYKN